MDEQIQKRIDQWQQDPFDAKTKEALLALKEKDPKALEDAFYTDLAFGTGGLRGIMGVGTNRMNEYTIRKTTQGLAVYLKSQFPQEEIGVVIGYDSRHHSIDFAKEAAHVLSHYGIRVYIFKEMRPTPFVSFACRHYRAKAAIMITASHNPKEYNGYKVYWEDGAQVVPPHDRGIIEAVNTIHSYSAPLSPDPKLIQWVDASLDLSYLNAIADLQSYPKENTRSGKDLKIVYTSLHGTGITLIPKALKDWGFSSLEFVEPQVIADGDFPTVELPNPEDKKALQMGIELLEKTESDLLFASDPDADRLGVVALHRGKATILTGNEIASICIEYLSQRLKDKSPLPANPTFVTTIVSSDLIDAICSFYGFSCKRVLTGFKYIGEKIRLWEEDLSHTFIYGAEESYGYLLGTHARDKDAVVSCCLLSEIALQLKKQNLTLVDFLLELYERYGIYRESQLSIKFSSGKEGMESMKRTMKSLRQTPPKLIQGKKVTFFEDYEKGLHDLPPSDVLYLRLGDRYKLIVRPSGTEPKIKVYGAIHLPMQGEIHQCLAKADEELKTMLESFRETIIG